MSEPWWRLTRGDWLLRLSPEELESLELRSRVRNLKRGESIDAPESPDDGVLVLAAGRAAIVHHRQGEEPRLARLYPGDLLDANLLSESNTGIEGMLRSGARSTFVLIPRDALGEALNGHPLALRGDIGAALVSNALVESSEDDWPACPRGLLAHLAARVEAHCRIRRSQRMINGVVFCLVMLAAILLIIGAVSNR